MVEITYEAIWPWHFVCWKFFLLQFLFLCLWLLCSYFLFIPSSVLEGYTYLSICPFRPCCTLYLLIVFSYDFLYLCAVYYNFSLFISNSIEMYLFSFFFMDLSNSLSILLNFSKGLPLVLLICVIVSFTKTNKQTKNKQTKKLIFMAYFY